ncbi:MAG: 50S ribosomal protein L1 [Gammaproteobacteria bacterium]|nr:50S ribosomal protein L1 [Gammaproteobacteria bacterium]MCY4210654.1 50S ribosomal protein L1 [Gammaproteobacteria bacterium]MCY4283429.1 50S ribosomal protein L1 [Gammaproteobacteria bacterium]MCY4337292.1 50S ribosomal protein L1 [Gammaproteobacteria bacterium]
MAKLSKRARAFNEKVNAGQVYTALDALNLLKENASAKFDETVEVAVNLGVDPRKSDQIVRGASVLPQGTGKVVKVAVFAQGEQADAARAAGAEYVGLQDLAEQVQAGMMDFNVAIAAPDAMPIVGKLGKLLGPRGLMPNPKVGTVTKDVGQAVTNAKAGQVRYRTDKNGIIHCGIGKTSFAADALKQNLDTLLADLKKAKPSAAKGIYLKKISLSTTMGPGVVVDQASL